jgi:hypothetical protein
MAPFASKVVLIFIVFLLLTLSESSSSSGSSSSAGIGAGISVAAVIVIALLIIIVVVARRRKQSRVATLLPVQTVEENSYHSLSHLTDSFLFIYLSNITSFVTIPYSCRHRTG